MHDACAVIERDVICIDELAFFDLEVHVPQHALTLSLTDIRLLVIN